MPSGTGAYLRRLEFSIIIRIRRSMTESSIFTIRRHTRNFDLPVLAS